jgi:hypothetical protein
MIKVIILIVLLIAIYLILSRIKLYHINTLPEKQKEELLTRENLRSILKQDYVRIPKKKVENFTNLVKKKNIFKKIKNKYLDPQFNFNLPNLPVTYHYPHSDRKLMDNYVKHVTKSIETWKKNLNFKLMKINPLQLRKTEKEFVITINIHIKSEKDYYMQMTFYGSMSDVDDFYSSRSITMQLINIKEINKIDFSTIKKSSMNFI